MKIFLTIVMLLAAFSGFGAMIPSPVRDTAGVLGSGLVYDDAEFPSCHAATIAETEDGGLLLSFFGGRHESSSDCSIWTCRYRNGEWGAPVLVADGVVDSVKTACWNPVLFQVPGGDLLLFYKVGSCVQEWTGWLVRSSDGGYSWSAPERLPDGILGPIKNKPVLIGDRLLCGTSLERGGWRSYLEVTDPEVSSWKTIGPLNDRKSNVQIIQPSILVHRDGTLQAVCRSIDLRGNIISVFSEDGGDTWGEPVSSGLPNNDSGLDAVALKDGRFLLVYNHISAVRNGAAARSPLNVALSDNGKDWYSALVLEDSPGDEYSYPSVIQTSDSLVHIVYTWHRKCVKHVVIDPSELGIDPARKIIDERWVEDPAALEKAYAAATDSILPLMTMEEKMDFLSGKWSPHDRGTHDLYGGGNDRLGLPRFKMEYGSSGIHTNGKSTSYPCPLALSASFDRDLVSRVAASIGEDARSRGIDAVIGPDLALYSERTEELQSNTFGDDPDHVAECAAVFAGGLKQAGIMPVARLCVSGGVSRDGTGAVLDKVSGDYGGLMLRGTDSGVKAVEDRALTDMLRTECGFDGILLSDLWETDSSLPSFLAGIDIDVPKGEWLNSSELQKLYVAGKISEADLDRRVREILMTMFRYGLMDGWRGADFRIPENRPESCRVAAEAAQKGIVLLENDRDILPLDGKEKSVLVLGNRVYRNSESRGLLSVYPFGQVTLADALAGRDGFDFLPEGREYIDLTLTGEFFSGDGKGVPGLRAEYFSGTSMSGKPDFSENVNYVDYAWGIHPPVSDFPSAGYSVRWSCKYSPASDAIVRFVLSGKGDCRLLIDGTEVCASGDGSASDKVPYLFLAEKGRIYDVRVEFAATETDPDVQLVYAPVPADGLDRRMRDADRIVLGIGSDGMNDSEMAFWTGLVRKYHNKTVVVMQSCDLSDMSWADAGAAALLARHSGQYAGRAIADILTGAVSPSGKMPVAAGRYGFMYGLGYKIQ